MVTQRWSRQWWLSRIDTSNKNPTNHKSLYFEQKPVSETFLEKKETVGFWSSPTSHVSTSLGMLGWCFNPWRALIRYISTNMAVFVVRVCNIRKEKWLMITKLKQCSCGSLFNSTFDLKGEWCQPLKIMVCHFFRFFRKEYKLNQILQIGFRQK